MVNFLPNPHNRHPIARPSGARYGVSFVSLNFDSYSASVNAVLYEISCCIGPCYNGTWLYFVCCAKLRVCLLFITLVFWEDYFFIISQIHLILLLIWMLWRVSIALWGFIYSDECFCVYGYSIFIVMDGIFWWMGEKIYSLDSGRCNCELQLLIFRLISTVDYLTYFQWN